MIESKKERGFARTNTAKEKVETEMFVLLELFLRIQITVIFPEFKNEVMFLLRTVLRKTASFCRVLSRLLHCYLNNISRCLYFCLLIY